MPGGVVDQQRALAMASATLTIAALACACEPTVVIGACAAPAVADGGEAGAAATPAEGTVAVPWTTGFEDGLCGYASVGGFCYSRHGARIELSESPSPRPGKFVAAFTVNADATVSDAERSQARCVIQGVMPRSAYYSASYFIPRLATSDGNWNLFHFLGGNSEADSHPLWDISLVNRSDGKLQLSVFNFSAGTHPAISADLEPVPIGRWFQLGIKIVRSARANGEVTVLQDGVVALHLTNLITDDTNWGQWYVGNYVKNLVPPLSTVYVDDVAIREEP